MVDTVSPPPAVPVPEITEAAVDEQLALDRFNIAALVAKADHRFLLGDHGAAAAFYSFALKCASARGVPDQRAVAAAARAADLRKWLAEHFRHYILSSLEEAGFPSSEWPERFRAGVEILLGERQRDLVYEQFPQMPTFFFYPGLPYVDFVDPSIFHWREAVEARFEDMRAEASALLADTAVFYPSVTKVPNSPQGDIYGMIDNSAWSSFHLWSNGGPVEEAAARCPTILQTVIDNVPLCIIGRRSPVFMLSLLKAGGRIPTHTGMSNIHYICHLPLIVPENCRFRVGERTIEWHEGELLVFDDSVEHDAHNGSGRDRLVLIFDAWHPHLTEQEKILIRTMLEAVEDYR